MKAALLLLAAQGELAIDVNQVGFAPDAPKLAIARTPDAAPRDWRVEDAAGKTILTGKTRPLPADPRAGGHQQAIDLSALTDPGKGYRIGRAPTRRSRSRRA